jgi:FkbM family methyltransferase
MNVFHIGVRGSPLGEWFQIKEHVDFYGFDADEEACKELNKRTVLMNSQQFFCKTFGGKKEERDFYITKNPECSSLYEPNEEIWNRFPNADSCKIEKVEKRDVTLLSDFCREIHVAPDFIKIDVQGAELEILEDVFDYLPKPIGIEMEVFFTPLYKNVPLFSDVIDSLLYEGFKLFGLKRCRWKSGTRSVVGGRLIFGDALFLREQDTEEFELICRKYKLFDLIDIPGASMSPVKQLRIWDEDYIF